MTHCKGEMFQEQWHIMLDDELLEAIHHGIVLMCRDGVERRFFIRIFTYSADYPEKQVHLLANTLIMKLTLYERVLIATTRQNGDCPCPRCFVRHDDLGQLGTPADLEIRDAVRRDDNARQQLVESARRKVFEDKVVVNNKNVEAMLKPQSLHPIMVRSNPLVSRSKR